MTVPEATDRTEQADLIGWLRAQLDTDERWIAGHPDGLDDDYLDMDGFSADVEQNYPCERYLRVSKKRALAEVNAKRLILDQHVISSRKTDRPPFDPYTGQPQPDEFEVECTCCGWAGEDPTGGCLTLLLLATPYADRPGYRPEWAP